MLAVLLLVAAAGSQAQCGGGPAGPGSALGPPAGLLGIYDQAAGAYQLGPQGWAYLAAINYVETSFGQDLSPSSQGAIGWMQFEPGTWAQYAVSADPTKPSAPPDPYDPWDAIFTAANDLHANGAPGDWPRAIYAYNHAGWYVSQVQQLAQRYTQTAGTAAVTIDASHAAPQAGCVAAGPTTPGSAARIPPDGLAAAPQDAPAPVQAAIAAGNQIIDTSYSTEREPNMLSTVMSSYDCSGSTDFVLYNAGLNAAQVDVGNGIAGDSGMLESYGDPGPVDHRVRLRRARVHRDRRHPARHLQIRRAHRPQGQRAALAAHIDHHGPAERRKQLDRTTPPGGFETRQHAEAVA